MEPDKRNGGCGVIFDDKLYVWGGQTLDIEQPDQSLELEGDNEPLEIITSLPRPDDDNHPFDVLDLSRMTWSRQRTTAKHEDKEDEEIPDLGLGSSLVLDPEAECFLLLGGLNELQFDNKVRRIFPGEWEWDIIEPSTDIAPTPRYLTGVIVHNNRLCIFGGVSPPIQEDIDKGARYEASYNSDGVDRGYGWNNEYFEMDLNTKEWKTSLLDEESVKRPDPIGGFAFTKIDCNRALMFGGLGVNGRVNEARIFDFEERKWSKPITPLSPDHPWPSPTRFPSLTALIDPELVGQRLCGGGPVLHQRLVLLWGKETTLLISKETWLLELEPGSEDLKWSKLEVSLKPRSWHIGLPRYHTGSTECQVIIFGGNVHLRGNTGARDNTADLRVLQFGVQSLFRCCMSAITRELASTFGPNLLRKIIPALETHTNLPTPPDICLV